MEEKAFENSTLVIFISFLLSERDSEQANFAYGEFVHLSRPGLGNPG